VGEHRSAETDIGDASCLCHGPQPPAIVVGDLIVSRSFERHRDAGGADAIRKPQQETPQQFRALVGRTPGYLELREDRKLPILLVEEQEPQLATVSVCHEMRHALKELVIRVEFEKCSVVRIWDRHPSIVRRLSVGRCGLAQSVQKSTKPVPVVETSR
jgi:hypothetical protein